MGNFVGRAPQGQSAVACRVLFGGGAFSAAWLHLRRKGSALAAEEQEKPICWECQRSSSRVFCGGEHTLLRDPETLEVYQLGACGLGTERSGSGSASSSAYAKKVPLSGPALSIFPGYYHNMFKLMGGRCVAYGCGRQAPNDGQLMNGSFEEEIEPVSTTMRFAEVVAGGHHSACRTIAGEVWVAGAGWQGQMGNGELTYKNPQPQRIASLPRVLQLGTGYYHTAAQTQDGDWFLWGCNEQGQLGTSALGELQVTTPRRLSQVLPELQGKRVRSFDGGYGHSLLLLEDGRVLTMGNHTEGQRGLQPDLEEVPVCNEVVGLPGPAQAIAAGNHHNLVLVSGRVYGFGSDEYGQVTGCGALGEEVDHRTWQIRPVLGLPEGDPIVRVSAGICHSAAQTAAGRVFLWGCGGNGQIGDASCPDSAAVTEVNVAEIAQRCRKVS